MPYLPPHFMVFGKVDWKMTLATKWSHYFWTSEAKVGIRGTPVFPMASLEAGRKQLSSAPHQPCPEGLFVLKKLIISHLSNETVELSVPSTNRKPNIPSLRWVCAGLERPPGFVISAVERRPVHVTSVMDEEFGFNQALHTFCPSMNWLWCLWMCWWILAFIHIWRKAKVITELDLCVQQVAV